MELFITKILIFCLFMTALYPIPSYIALGKNHKDLANILLLNLTLGWTFIGWIIAVIWSLTNNKN
jgi:hypothetical protein